MKCDVGIKGFGFRAILRASGASVGLKPVRIGGFGLGAAEAAG
jgi:hypothetical protein